MKLVNQANLTKMNVKKGKVREFWGLKRPVAAVCHGTLILARTTTEQGGQTSLLKGMKTTAVTKDMVQSPTIYSASTCIVSIHQYTIRGCMHL